MNATATLHPFEAAGMGRAPYRFASCASLPSPSLAGENPEAYNAAMRDLPNLKAGLGTCACCGMAITNIYVVRDGAGDLWGVGCDCIDKLDRPESGLRDESTLALVRAARQARLDRERQRRGVLADRKLAQLRALLADEGNRSKLSAKPHSLAFRAERGETMLNWAEWMLMNCGDSGRARLLKHLTAMVA